LDNQLGESLMIGIKSATFSTKSKDTPYSPWYFCHHQ